MLYLNPLSPRITGALLCDDLSVSDSQGNGKLAPTGARIAGMAEEVRLEIFSNRAEFSLNSVNAVSLINH